MADLIRNGYFDGDELAHRRRCAIKVDRLYVMLASGGSLAKPPTEGSPMRRQAPSR